MLKQMRKPRIGALLITTPRFRNLGEGTESGVYWQRKEKEAQQLLARLDYADITFPGIVYTREDVQGAMRAFAGAEVDMVFALFLSWSDDFAWVRFLRDMPPIPILFAGMERDALGFDDSLNEDRFVEFLSAGGLVGMLEGSGSDRRFDRPMMRRVWGTQAQVLDRLSIFARAACLRAVLKQSTFGLLPSYNEVMWSTYVDPYVLFQKAGPELRFLSLGELNEAIEAQPAAETEAVAQAILATYPQHGEIQGDKMLASVEASLALEKVARAHGVEMLVLNDVDPVMLRQIGLRPGFTPCPGTDDLMVVPEGDIGGGIACYVLGRLTGDHVGYMEPFHVDRKTGTFHAGHAGPNDYTDPQGRTVLSTDARFAKSDYKHAGAPFAWHTFSPGEKTMLHVSQSGQGFKMAVSVVDCLPCEHFLSGYTHGVFRPRILAEEFFDKLIHIGVTQHYGIVAGDHTAALEEFAALMDFEFHRV